MKLHHVGVCSKNIEKSIKDIKKIHNIVEQTDIIFDPLQNAELCMITIEDGTKIELISGKVVENLIRKKIDYYHTHEHIYLQKLLPLLLIFLSYFQLFLVQINTPY